MRQVSLNYKTGAIHLENVNPPVLQQGGVLIQSCFSVISAGTEGKKVKEGKMSYLAKARARPDQFEKVLDTVRQQGPLATYRKVMNRLDSLIPLGYSISGIVMRVGSNASEFSEGQRVACAGGGYANHAEVNFVPKNLVVPVPDKVTMKHAAFATLGAIVLHGFRQAELQMGETACVIGLGLLGQILVQVLCAAGVHVVGVDLLDSRCKLAKELGATFATTPDDTTLRTNLSHLTMGNGVDAIIIAADGNSNEPVELAAEIARDRARVVDIGRTSMGLPWKEYYEKELDVRFSRSYGPGRYDPNYEERGVDYPIGYVRWTERRNLAAFLDLVAVGKVLLSPIISAVYPFHEAERVYKEIAEAKSPRMGIVFQYSEQAEATKRLPGIRGSHRLRSSTGCKVRLGIIGAGNYASSVLLPHLARHKDVYLAEVATATGLSAANAARKFAFGRVTTDYRALLEASDIDAVIIATRHASHASMTSEALLAGKAVFVEKPLAIDIAGVRMVQQAIEKTGNRRILVGFNRRFSPLVRKLGVFFKNVISPLILSYRVHAGQMPPGSWYVDLSQGSRFVGEAGHFLDVFSFLTQARPISVMATTMRYEKVMQDDLENVVVHVNYENGSVGNLLYLTQGGAKVAKEYLEVFGGGRTAQLNDFKALTLFEDRVRHKVRAGAVNKGHKEELDSFVSSVKSGREMPIPVDSLLSTTLTTLAVTESLRTGQPVELADYLAKED